MMAHVTHRLLYQGSAWGYHTLLDKSLNKKLKGMIRLRHQQRFEVMALSKGASMMDRWNAVVVVFGHLAVSTGKTLNTKKHDHIITNTTNTIDTIIISS